MKHLTPPSCARRFALLISLGALVAPATAAASACPAGHGDVNADSAITVVDAQCAIVANLWTLAGASAPQPTCFFDPASVDLTCDEVLDVSDVQLSIQLVLDVPLAPLIDANQDNCPDACESSVDPDACSDEFLASSSIDTGCPLCGDGLIDSVELMSLLAEDPEPSFPEAFSNMAVPFALGGTTLESPADTLTYTGAFSSSTDSDVIAWPIAPGLLAPGESWTCRVRGQSPVAEVLLFGGIGYLPNENTGAPLALINGPAGHCGTLSLFIQPSLPLPGNHFGFVSVQPLRNWEPCPATYTVDCRLGPSSALADTPECGLGSCGNGVLDPGETCDDGGQDVFDGCNGACYQEFYPSMLAITEVMATPSPAAGAAAEWFEVFNPTAFDIDLMHTVIRDDGEDTHTIAEPLIVPAGGYAVLGASTDPAENGGASVDYAYSNFILDGDADEIILDRFGVILDDVAYDLSATAAGVSAELAADAQWAECNDLTGGWCAATQPFGAGDLGSPGGAASDCESVYEYGMEDVEVLATITLSQIDTSSIFSPYAPSSTSTASGPTIETVDDPGASGVVGAYEPGVSEYQAQGTFASATDADALRWTVDSGSPPLWTCRISGLAPGGVVALMVRSQDTAGGAGAGSGQPNLAVGYVQNDEPVVLMGPPPYDVGLLSVAIVPITPVPPCFTDYTVTCRDSLFSDGP